MNNVKTENNTENQAVCSRCGLRFDSSLEGFVHDETNQTMCSACYRKEFESHKIGSIILNFLVLPFAILLFAGGILNLFDGDMEAGIFGAALGGALILWRIIAALIQKGKSKNWKNLAKIKASEVLYWTCSHCGASAFGATCEYCDSPYEGKKRK